MSVLEGGIDYRKVYPIRNPYGDRLNEIFCMELDGATDVTVNEKGDTAYIVGSNLLYIFDIKQPKHPVLLSKMEGIGSGRQIEVSNGLACVTSRQDGLFIIDVKNAKEPQILYRYDTVELATGVCISGDFCFVTCRHMGVEIIDISNPAHPVHISNVLAGEAQSVFVDGHYMYVGAWVNREINIFDISDPANPKLLSACPLDGFGDGVFVRDNICFSATGHHGRNLSNRTKYAEYDFVTASMLNDGYGGGHGLEIFDVTDKEKPKLLSRIKTPPLFYSSCDMWDVIVSGDYAFLADTFNGTFIINIKDLNKPFFEGYKRLGVYNSEKYLHQPSIQQLCNPVAGIAVIKDHVLAVSPYSGLHILHAPGKGKSPVSPRQFKPVEIKRKSNDSKVVFRANGQLHAIVFFQQYLVTAAGNDGIYVLDHKNNFSVIEHKKIKGYAMDIKTDGKYLYVAEGSEGFAVYDLNNGTLKELSRYKNKNRYESVRQVVLYSDYNLAAVLIGNKEVAFIDISNPGHIAFKDIYSVDGNLYYKNIVNGLLNNRFAAAVPLSPKTYWFDLQNNHTKVLDNTGLKRDMCPIEEGIAIKDDIYLSVFRGKYYISQDINHIPSEKDMISVNKKNKNGLEEEIYLSGWPRIIGKVLYLINRMNGVIQVVNIEDLHCPVLLDKLVVDGNPEDILYHDGALWIPCGHGGLCVLPSVYEP